MTFRHGIVSGATASLLISTALIGVRIGSIGSLSSDTDLSALCGAEIAIEETDAVDGMSGKKFILVSADTGEDVIEGAKVYEYLVETEEADSIIFGSIDDVSLGWLPHMQEFQIPTLDTWTFHVGIISMVVEGPETMASYLVNTASGGVLTTLYINLGVDVLRKETGWDSVVTLAEDTAFGEAITGLVTEALGPIVGIETEETITYDVGTVDFASLFSKA